MKTQLSFARQLSFQTCRKVKGILYPLLLIAIVSFSGCVQVGQLTSNAIQKPQLTVASIDIDDISLKGVNLNVALEVDNPNSFPIALSAYNYKINVNNSLLAEGAIRSGFKVKGNNTGLINVPVKATFKQLQTLMGSLDKNPDVSYDISANMFVDLPLLSHLPIKAEKQGTIAIPQLPTIDIADIKVKKISFSGIDLAINVEIQNPNQFNVFLKSIDYQLSVDDMDWLDGSLDEPINLVGGGKHIVSIPLRLSLFKMGQSFVDRLTNSEPFNYHLNGNIIIDSDLPFLKDLSLPIGVQGAVAAL